MENFDICKDDHSSEIKMRSIQTDNQILHSYRTTSNFLAFDKIMLRLAHHVRYLFQSTDTIKFLAKVIRLIEVRSIQ